MKKILYLFYLIFVLSGCSLYQVTSEETTFDYYPPKASKYDVVFLERVTEPHKVIGYVTVNAERNQKRQRIIERLKYEAALIGGDAITNITTNDGTGRWAKRKPAKLFGNANIRENYMADVVVFETTPTPSPLAIPNF